MDSESGIKCRFLHNFANFVPFASLLLQKSSVNFGQTSPSDDKRRINHFFKPQ